MIVQHQTEQSSTVIHNKVQSDSRSELVIIDSRAPNFQQLHNDVIKAQQQGRDINVVILDAHRDGIEQISDALSKYNKLDAVHIVSHGKDGQLQLGATQLNNQNLKQNNEEINKWKQVFTEGGDLLIYGCNLAGTSNGTDLVNSLSGLTGADVAASDDVTGNNVLGGDWDLEYQVGDIETSIAFTADIQDNWQGTLNADALAAEQAAVEEQQQQEQVQAEQEAALIAEAEAVLLAEEKEAETITLEPEQQAGIVEEQRQEILFIDEAVDDYQTFIDDIQANSDASTSFEIVLLDNNSDGVERISEILDAYNEVDALHILSHGDDGAVKLGNTWLNADNTDQYSESLSAWSDSLDVNADLMIYGCNLAGSAQGEQFVAELAQITGADVAASDDNTGHALLNGDWELEYRHGDIETSVAVSEDLQASWSSVLVSFSVDTSADTADAAPGDGLAQDASGNTSLRAAIEEANVLGGAHTITLGAGNYDLSLGTISISSDLTITGAGAGLTVIDAQDLNRVLAITGGTVSISGVTLQNGDAGGGDGGGVHVANSAVVSMRDVVLTGNDGHFGGAIWNDGTLTLDRVTLDLNNGSYGGGLYNRGNATVTDSTISNNTATNGGVGEGGGLWTSGAGNTLDLTNVTISGNSTDGDGGGLYNGKDATLTNVTITNNQATQGAGIHDVGNAATTTLTNTIVAGNGTPGQEDLSGNYTSGGNNLIGIDGPSTGLTDGVNGDQVGTAGAPIDPLLGALADNGGHTQTHALLTGSTAIDGGTNTGAPTTDQRGATRDASVDIGAHEFAASVPAVALDASSSGSTIDQASVTVSHTTLGTNRLMLVGISMNPSGESVSSVTYNGVNLTHVGTQEDGSATTRVEIWQLVAPDTGTHDVIVNFSNSGHKGAAVGVMTFNGVNQTTPTLSFAGDSGMSTSASTTVASATDDLVFGVVAVDKGTTVTPGAGQTEYWDIDINSINGAGTTEAGAAAVTTSWTNLNEDWSAAAVSIQADTNSATITQVNNTGSTVAEGGTDTITNTELRYDDDQQPATSVTYSVTTGPANGQLELTSNPGVPIASFTQDDLDNNRVVYIHNGSETISDSFIFDVDDGQGNSITGQNFSITVNPVNDAPIFIDGAIGNWNFDEGSGDSVAEGAVGISTATLGSTTGADANDPTWTSGIFGQALHFDGVNDYVEIADAPGIDISGPEFSASLWIKPDRGPGTEDMFFMKGDRQGIGNVNYYLSWKDTGKMTWAFKSDGGFEYLDMDVTLPTVDEWNHVAVVFDRPTVSIYINGTKYTSSIGTGGTSMDKDLVANDDPLWIGAGRDGGSIVTPGNFSAPFSGAIDELAIFDRALTDADVEAIRTSTPPVVTASSFSINENSANNTLVGTVVANDQDVGDTLSYAITAGNTGGAFSIDGNGQITVADSAALDFETNPVFNLTIEATDDGTPAKSDTASVSISLNDVNDAPVARPDGVHLSFDGDDFVEVADNASLQMTNEVTMEARIKHDGTGTGSQVIVNKEGEYELGITANTGEIKFAIARSDNTWAWHNTGYFVTAGEWTHVAVTYDGISGEARTYINGELVDAYSQSGSIGDVYVGLNNLWIGGRENDPLDRFEGQIDEVRVWNTTRTLGEIQANKDGQLGGAEAGLVGNWRLDDAAGGVVIDQSSFGNDGILGGSEGAAATPSYQGYVTDQNTVLNIAAGAGVLANDSDIDSGSLTVTNLDTTGMLGNLVLNIADGSFSYDPNGAFDYLDAGEQATETFSYTANDGSLDSNTVTATITITGVNDAPVIGGVDTGSVTEDVDPDLDTLLETSGVLTIADPDTGESSFVAETITGTYGNLVIDTAGNWSYGSDKTQAAIQALGVGETLIDALVVTTADGSTHKVVITINGAADAPVANNDSYTINEDSTLTTNDWHLSSADWPYRQQITFDNSAQTENLTDFAVLVKLDATRIDYTHTQNNGEDLRFFDADGTLLDYEIEKWDEAGASYVWVKVPQIDSSSNTDNIWMYYGNGAATSGETPANVWDSNYVGVWHLGEEQAGTANTGLYQDSTSYNNDGTDNVAAIGQDGSIGDGQQFSGAGDSIDIAHSDELNLTDAMTLSFWINPSVDSGNFNRVIEKGAFGYHDSYYFGGGAGTNDLGFYLNWDVGNTPVIETGDNVLIKNVWQQATVTLTSAGDATMFLNGVIIGTGTYSGGAFAGNTEDLHLSFSDSSYDFAGGIDEVRISNTARSSDWVAAEYLTMTDSFASFGGEETTVLPDGVRANDTDVEGDALTVNTTPIIDVSNGALTLNADGTFTYTPDANYNGTDSFTYEVSDGNGGTHQATVTISVNAVNDAPTAADKTIITPEDTTYTFTLSDFGYSDVDGDTIAVVRILPIYNNVVELDGVGLSAVVQDISITDINDGKLTFEPPANGWGTADFMYFVVNDGIDDSAYKTMTANITPVNDAPVANTDPGIYTNDLVSLNPLSYWRLGETTGAAADLGSSANAGTYNGGSLNQSGGISGDIDTSVYFDGSDYIEVAHSDDYLLDNGTIQLWFNADNVANGDLQHLFSKDSQGNDTGGHVSMYLTATGDLQVRLQSASADYIISSSSAVSQGEWHHATLSFGSAGMALYLDGALVDTDAYTGGLGTTSGGIGNYRGNCHWRRHTKQWRPGHHPG